jgi:hypothetical protein
MPIIQDTYQLNVKYIKLVSQIEDRETGKWSYDFDKQEEIDLAWPNNPANKSVKNRASVSKLKGTNAKKAIKGERILLCQNNALHGHPATHVVEIIDNPSDAWFEYEMWFRKAKVIWIPKTPWEDNAPESKKVTGYRFKDGNIISVNPYSQRLRFYHLG